MKIVIGWKPLTVFAKNLHHISLSHRFHELKKITYEDTEADVHKCSTKKVS